MSTPDDQTDREPPSKQRDQGLTITLSGCEADLTAKLRRAARQTLQSEGYRCGRLDIAVVGDTEMRRQHARWMGVEAATDVLSFDLRDEIRVGRVDGQLLVCKSVARRRARSRDLDWRAELALYVVHGCLHLCGYDDHGQDDMAAMHRREDDILSSLGWGPVYSGKRANGGGGRRSDHARRGGRSGDRLLDARRRRPDA